jgi:hypothetical protein
MRLSVSLSSRGGAAEDTRPDRPRKEEKPAEGDRGQRDSEMGMGDELWDDSALVVAFDRAISTFNVCLLVSRFLRSRTAVYRRRSC